MAKESAGRTMTRSEMANRLAEQLGLTRRQVMALFEAQAALAYKHAKNEFVIPGIGKFVLRESPARQMMMRFGPKAGEVVKVPRRMRLKFRIAKAARDAILTGTDPQPDDDD